MSVGYEYESCASLILWEKRTTILQGYELDPTSLGGWSLDKHHILNTRSGKFNVHTLIFNFLTQNWAQTLQTVSLSFSLLFIFSQFPMCCRFQHCVSHLMCHCQRGGSQGGRLDYTALPVVHIRLPGTSFTCQQRFFYRKCWLTEFNSFVSWGRASANQYQLVEIRQRLELVVVMKVAPLSSNPGSLCWSVWGEVMACVCCSRHPSQRQRWERLCDGAASSDHKHHGKWAQAQHFMPKLQRPCRWKQAAGARCLGDGHRWKPLCRRPQLCTPGLPLHEHNGHPGVKVKHGTDLHSCIRTPCVVTA